MKSSTHIPVWRTFLNWIIAVLIGSVIWPVLSLFFKGGPDDLEEAGALMLISAVVSAMTSFPTILLMTLVNWQLNKRDLVRKAYQLIHTAIHLFLAMLTFFVLYIFADHLSSTEAFQFLLIAFSYTLAGICTWTVTFAIYRRKALSPSPYASNILDEVV
jgi:drug/metabolite transporter (DMT)-like permease